MTQTSQLGISDNAAGAIAYFTFIPAIVFLMLPPYCKSSFVRFHAWQSIFLTIVAIVVNIALSVLLPFSLIFATFLFVASIWLVWLAWILLWIICGVEALNGKLFKLPIIGNLAEKRVIAQA
ncbi:MAG: hypothetical protein WAK26_06580 [Terracidiphilus sp.]|jgi:uncharacterized membrane protein